MTVEYALIEETDVGSMGKGSPNKRCSTVPPSKSKAAIPSTKTANVCKKLRILMILMHSPSS